MMKVVSFLIKILKYKVLSFLVSNFDILADSLHQEDRWSKVVHEGEEIYKRSVVKAVLLEVSPCTFPAYDSSEISCRSFEKVKEEAKEEKRLEKLKMEARLMQLREENEKEF